MEQKLRSEAKALLEQGKVDYIIGFEPGSLKFTTTPLITREKDALDRLVINPFIVNNLANFHICVLPNFYRRALPKVKSAWYNPVPRRLGRLCVEINLKV